MLLKVHRPLSGDFGHLLAYDEARKHTTFIPTTCDLGGNLVAAMGHAPVAYFQAEVGELAGDGEDARFVPHPEGSIIWIDATHTVSPQAAAAP